MYHPYTPVPARCPHPPDDRSLRFGSHSHNTVDPFQRFGTEQHDFVSAMYGELTARIDTCGNAAGDLFHGRNATLRESANTSFSGVGHLSETRSGAEVIIYENVFAAHPLPFGDIPDCITTVRVELNRTD